jgi:hypothetical protein
MAKDINNRVLELQVNLNKVLIELNKMTQEGGNSVQSYEKLRQKFEELLSAAKGVEGSINRSYGQTKNVELYKKRLQDLVTALNKIKTANNQIDSEVKSQLKEQAELREKNLKTEQRLLRSSIKEGNARRTADLKEFEARQKAFRNKRLAREKQIEREKTAQFKKEEKERTRIANQEGRKRDKEAQQKDFRGGFGAQLTPRAIGGALGSLTKYLGLYQAINAAQRIFRELTLGSVREAIAFEKALANLGAVAGATAEEVNALGKNALSVAGSTKFTAQEIVGLQTELSKLGFESEDVIKSTQAIAFAAQALGSPLESTAALVGKLKNQFGLLIEETTMISDVLVTSINESALSFDSFGTAMQYVGPIAKNLGLTLEQTAGAMAVLADNGFTASRIGTGLRGIFTELGKTSADVEKSLKNLAEQNISLSEAVDLVGKRNAAQLITLLKNIDAIDEANDKYYQQGRALISAAKQADTFSGQMDILTSNFKEFQINLGNAVVDSNIFIRVLGFLSDKAEQTALGFKFLREVGLQGFQKDVKTSIDEGIDPLTVSLERMIESGKITTTNLERVKRAFREAANESERLGVSIQPSAEALEELGISPEQFSMLEGYFDLLEDGIAKQVEQTAITKGQTQATANYGKEVEALIDSSLEGNNVNKEAETLFKNLGANISSYEAKLKSANGVTEEQRIEYEASINVLKGYQEQVTNTILSTEELAKRKKAERDKAAREEQKRLKGEIDAIKEATAEQIASINERAKVETEIAETAEERAAIEAERQKIVSDLYSEQADSIGALSYIYSENKDLILQNVKASEKLAAVLGSDVIDDVNKAYSEYGDELESLQKALDDGKIGQDDYERSVSELRQRLVSTIATFREMFGTTPEMEKFFENTLMNFDALSANLDDTDDKAKNTAETLKEFFKDFKEGGYLEYVEQLFSAISDSLDEFNKTTTENTKNELESQLDSIKNRYEIEQDILKSQLDNQLITESQYRKKQIDLRKAQLAEENTINQEIFEAEKKQDVNNAKIEGLETVAKAIIKGIDKYGPTPAGFAAGALGASIVIAQTGAQVAAINQRKFFPKKFAEGGVVQGPSHEQGGVPFAVRGQSGYEMEGGEFIVNRKATSMHRDLLERINNSYKTKPTVGRMKFAQGGLVPNAASESVDYLKAIAEATTSTAIGVSKPVRAYVADKDLRSNDTERRLRDRNDRI